MAYRMSSTQPPSYYVQYPKTHLEASSNLFTTYVAYGVLAVIGLYHLLQHSDLLPFPSLFEICWNGFVYIIPPTLVIALESRNARNTDVSVVQEVGYAGSRTFAAKSASMRRILRLDNPVSWTGRISTPNMSTSRNTGQGPAGLGNWDHSCYQNSVLQGLASMSSITSFLDRTLEQGSYDCSNSTNQALKELINKLNDSKNAGTYLWTPAVLKSMNSWQQQDAQEYFSKILDEVDTEAARVTKSQIQHDGLCEVKELLALPGPCATVTQARNPASADCGSASPSAKLAMDELPEEIASLMLRNPLEGLLAQRVGCLQCGYVEGLSLIPFNCLTLPLGRRNLYDIRECLDEYTNLEDITGVECGKCTLVRQKSMLEKYLDRRKDDLKQSDADDTLYASFRQRLQAVEVALSNSDYSENTLLKQCQIPSKNRVSTTKTRQAVIARLPKCLVMHVNRSIFDELTGAQSKNHATVRFHSALNCSPWSLGSIAGLASPEEWSTDPARSMLAGYATGEMAASHSTYTLRAVITHYGRHENGHYICYRKKPRSECEKARPALSALPDEEQWWRISDDEVSRVSEATVLAQTGVFMLFYERVDEQSVAEITAPMTDEATDTIKIPEDSTEDTLIESESSGPEPTGVTERLSCDTDGLDSLPAVSPHVKEEVPVARGREHLKHDFESLTTESQESIPDSNSTNDSDSFPSSKSKSTDESDSLAGSKSKVESSLENAPQSPTPNSSISQPIAPPMRTSGASKKDRTLSDSMQGLGFGGPMISAN